MNTQPPASTDSPAESAEDAQGRVEAIYVTSDHGAPTESAARVEVIRGAGLGGDRHYNPQLADSANPKHGRRAVTLIEAEQVEAFNARCGLSLSAGETRRNVVTRGVNLNELVGREFSVGSVRLQGTELCEPCAHLASMTHAEVLRALAGKAGLCARVLVPGWIERGDRITMHCSGDGGFNSRCG